jgi:hypothetical protein
MRLYEITTDRGMDIIAEAVPALGRIIKTDTIKGFIKKYGNERITQALAIKAVLEVIPDIFKESKADVLAIVSAFTGKTLAAVRKQPFLTTFGELKEIVTDPDFMQLFNSSVNTEPGASSVSSPEAAVQSDATESL